MEDIGFAIVNPSNKNYRH